MRVSYQKTVLDNKLRVISEKIDSVRSLLVRELEFPHHAIPFVNSVPNELKRRSR
ncbi:MAG: hypothetical protein V1890_05605 [Candidatus Zixiibacteriota bacterium]